MVKAAFPPCQSRTTAPKRVAHEDANKDGDMRDATQISIVCQSYLRIAATKKASSIDVTVLHRGTRLRTALLIWKKVIEEQ